MENITDSDIFINTYIKKQEEFVVKLIREKLEFETKLQLLEAALIEKINEKNNVDSLLTQSVIGVQTLTIERDALNREITDLKIQIEEVQKHGNDQVQLFRSKCEELQRSLYDEKEKNKDLEKIKIENDTLKTNYELVKRTLEELQGPSQLVIDEKTSKKKRSDKDSVN